MLQEIIVSSREDGWRLDKVVVEKAPPWVSRTFVQRQIKNSKVFVNSTKETSENVMVEEAVDKITQHVERGGRLEQPLREADIFPDVVVDMIAIGEEAGKLDLMLFKVADLYDGEIDRSINTLASSLQPILIVVMGFLTAFVALAMFWPYFRMAQILGTGF